MPICVSCGTDNEERARYCRECGVELGRATTPDTHPDTVVQGESWTQEEQRPDTHADTDTVVARESWTQERPPPSRVTGAWDLVNEAKQRVENLTPQQVAAELQAGGVTLVDLRETEERLLHGAIPGAVHVPRGLLEFVADPTTRLHRPELAPDRRIIVHCAAGGRSALAADVLTRMGHTQAAHLEGGFAAWRAWGGPVVPVEGTSPELAH